MAPMTHRLPISLHMLIIGSALGLTSQPQPQSSSVTKRVRIDPKSGHFIDTHGRVMVFHGVNVVQKSFPWHPSLGKFDTESSLNAEDMANLKKWGFNVVRLGVMWPGVEPVMGEYNATYLRVMRQIVDDLYSHGIYTIVDFHQDSMSQQWCGEGIPAWMLPLLGPLRLSCDNIAARIGELIGQCRTFASFNISIDPSTGFPNEAQCLTNTFDAYSRTPELVSAWGNFYGNDTIQKKFQAFWSRVAAEFAESPGVLAYDLLNEPLNGDFFADPERLVPGHLDRAVLQPMYQSLHDVIRNADPSAIIMYEPPPFPDTYPHNIPIMHGVYPTGFESGPAKEDVAHQALSYHVYSCGFAVGDCDRHGDTPSADCPVCDQVVKASVTTRDADSKRLGGGVFMTEFGACSGSDRCLAELHRVLGQADAAFHSWAYWQFKYFHDITTVSGPIEGFYNEDASLQTAKVAALSRTYAQAVAGQPHGMMFEPDTGAFRLVYEATDSTSHLPTEVYANTEMHYNETGYTTHTLNGTARSNGSNQLYVMPNAAGLRVSLAIFKPYRGAASGTFHSADGDIITWNVAEANGELDQASESSGVSSKPGFDLSTSSHIDWWKSAKIFTDDGTLLCELSLQDSNHGPVGCDLMDWQRHDFMFNYRIELWKAETLGIHRYVDTITSSLFGPLFNKRISFTWLDDKLSSERAEIVV